IVVDEERGLRAITRGTVQLSVVAAVELDQSALSAANLVTWREIEVPAARTWELHLIDDAQAAVDQDLVPLDHGIVDASRMAGEVRDGEEPEDVVPATSEEPRPITGPETPGAPDVGTPLPVVLVAEPSGGADTDRPVRSNEPDRDPTDGPIGPDES